MAYFNTYPSSLVILFLFLVLSSTAVSSSKFLCHQKDAIALLKLKESLGNPWFWSDWARTRDCCGWAGASCDVTIPGRRVTDIFLQSSNASGTISPAISQLTKLRSILIHKNPGIRGTIPSSIGKLKHLYFLLIAESPLITGYIPKSLCNTPKLADLQLQKNNLIGSIPSCFSKKLHNIDFSSNRLSGPIPSALLSRRTTDIPVRLDLSNNSLTGAVPKTLANVAFSTIDLSFNRLTDATALFGEAKKTRDILLSNNRLNFDLLKVTFPLNLERLKLDHNRLTGSIPQQITELKNLMLPLDFSYNNLCGPLPTGGIMSSNLVGADSFLHNKCLCGAPLQPCH